MVLPSTITSPYTVTFDNSMAGTNTSDPVGTTATGGCNPYSYSTSLWLSFTPATSGPYTLSLCGSSVTSVLSGYTAANSCGPYTPVGICLLRSSTLGAANADLTNDPSTTVTLTAGVSFYLELSNYYWNDIGTQSLTITRGSSAPSTIVNFAGPTVGSTAGGTLVTITGAGFVSGATVAFGGVAATGVTLATPNLITAIAPAHAAATVDVTVTDPSAAPATLRSGFSYVSPLIAAPTGVTALATSTTSVHLSWNGVAAADNYDLYRSSAGGAYTLVQSLAPAIGNTGIIAWDDTADAPNTAYLYRVRAGAGGVPSAPSNSDLATTVMFTDDPLTTGGPVIKAAHLAQLRTAVNAVQALAGMTRSIFTDASLSGMAVKAVHIGELRSALAAARASLGLSSVAYSNPASTGAPIRAADVVELRGGVK